MLLLTIVIAAKEPLKNVDEAVSSRQKLARKRSLYDVINEHFEPIFNAEMATQVVFQRFPKEEGCRQGYSGIRKKTSLF